jgi:hypothetical protein
MAAAVTGGNVFNALASFLPVVDIQELGCESGFVEKTKFSVTSVLGWRQLNFV